MVITVSKDRILEQKGVVDQFGYSANYQAPPGTGLDGTGFLTPKYWCTDPATGTAVGNPYAQIDTSTEINPCGTDGCHYAVDGY